MRSYVIDLTTKKFGHLLVLGYKNGKWECLCDCGKTVHVKSGHLRRKHGTKSCGCFRLIDIGNGNRTHGLTRTSEYAIWNAAKMRCYNPKDKGFKNYGGRGIKMCKKWIHNFEAFLNDIGKRPSKFHSIERINNNGNYEPHNVRWAIKNEQCNNRRSNRFVTFEGEKHTLAQWAKITGIEQTLLRWRLRHWPINKAFTQPIRDY